MFSEACSDTAGASIFSTQNTCIKQKIEKQ